MNNPDQQLRKVMNSLLNRTMPMSNDHLCVCQKCGRVCLGRIDGRFDNLRIPWHRVGHDRCAGTYELSKLQVPEKARAGMKVDLETGELECSPSTS